MIAALAAACALGCSGGIKFVEARHVLLDTPVNLFVAGRDRAVRDGLLIHAVVADLSPFVPMGSSEAWFALGGSSCWPMGDWFFSHDVELLCPMVSGDGEVLWIAPRGSLPPRAAAVERLAARARKAGQAPLITPRDVRPGIERVADFAALSRLVRTERQAVESKPAP